MFKICSVNSDIVSPINKIITKESEFLYFTVLNYTRKIDIFILIKLIVVTLSLLPRYVLLY